MSFVQVTRLTKRHAEFTLFKNLDFSVDKGDFVTLLGPSGCGKTTLLKCIAGLTTSDAGTIRIDGSDVTHVQPKDRNIGFVFQSYALFPNMTVEENISFGLRLRKTSKTQIKEAVNDMIHLMELEERERYYPHQLSGGQQQRVALARALVLKPKILLMDEPLNALDARIRKNLRLEIRKIQKKLQLTTVFVTHDQEEALILSDRIYVMNKGSFIQSGTPEEIYTLPNSEFVANFIGNYNVFTSEHLSEMTGVPFAEGNYALRPEAILLQASNNAELNAEKEIAAEEQISNLDDVKGKFTVRGVVQDVLVLGNIIRYTVIYTKHKITVEVLNCHSHKILDTGTEVDLFIPKEQCILLASDNYKI